MQERVVNFWLTKSNLYLVQSNRKATNDSSTEEERTASDEEASESQDSQDQTDYEPEE